MQTSTLLFFQLGLHVGGAQTPQGLRQGQQQHEKGLAFVLAAHKVGLHPD